MILHIIPTLKTGGAELQLQALVAKNGEHCILTIADHGVIHMIRVIRKYKPKVVQGWLYYGDLAATLALYLSGRRKQTKLFWGVRCSDMDLSQYGIKLRLAVWLCTKLSRLPDGIIANSFAGLRHHARLGYVNKFYVIPNGIDTKKFKPIEYERIQPIVIRVARNDPIKDQKSFDDVAYRLPWAKFVTVNGIKNCEMPKVYAKADCLLSTSLSEGFPNVIAEAMACGVPVVATDVGDTKDIIGDTGILVEPRNVAAMTAGVRLLLEEKNSRPEAARNRSQAARDRIVNNFSIELALERFNTLYSGTPNNQSNHH